MSLNAKDRQALALIEKALADGDPPFATKLAAFSRLADGEMPDRERIRGDRRRAVGRTVLGLRASWPGTHDLMHWIAVAIWVPLSLALISAGIGLSGTGAGTACPEWPPAVCVRRAAPSPPPAPSGQRGRGPSLVPYAG